MGVHPQAVLGAPLEAGKDLYPELQRTYMHNQQLHNFFNLLPIVHYSLLVWLCLCINYYSCILVPHMAWFCLQKTTINAGTCGSSSHVGEATICCILSIISPRNSGSSRLSCESLTSCSCETNHSEVQCIRSLCRNCQSSALAHRSLPVYYCQLHLLTLSFAHLGQEKLSPRHWQRTRRKDATEHDAVCDTNLHLQCCFPPL